MAIITIYLALLRGFTDGSDSKESACNAGDPGQEDPLEKEMATHASTLAWRIPRTEELDGPQYKRVGYVSATNTFLRARFCSKHFMYISSANPPYNSTGKVLLLSPLNGWGN